jgi:hypothetical protein
MIKEKTEDIRTGIGFGSSRGRAKRRWKENGIDLNDG